MNYSTLFRTKENLNLDKNTLTNLRYIAIFGQFLAINIVYFYLALPFPIELSYLIIFIGLLTNLYLQFGIKINQLKDFYASIFLVYDLIQLSTLLYLTGGIFNPFCFLLIIPTIVSSTFLSMGTTIILGFITSLLLLIISFFHLPLPGEDMNLLHFPNFYKTGIIISIFIGLIFLSYFGIQFTGETKKRSEALNKLQEVISKEYELESLGGQAAAAAHSLGTPLSTIKIISQDLLEQLNNNKDLKKDIQLLVSQVDRCNDILKRLSINSTLEDDFIGKDLSLNSYLKEVVLSFKEISNKNFNINTEQDTNSFHIKKSIEIIYGIRNFIGNANKYANKNIYITIKSDSEVSELIIEDDGPGFSKDILTKIGEPYIKSLRSDDNKKSGLGLGIFIGKTLLEKNYAKILFRNSETRGGAEIKIEWLNKSLTKI